MAEYLVQPSTGVVYIATSHLKERVDMIPYKGPIVNGRAPGYGDVPPLEAPKEAAAEGAESTLPDPNKLTLIKEAIAGLTPENFTKGGLPKADVLEEVLGFSTTKAEREKAMEEIAAQG